ncbi:MAG TPA: hypothetical protein VFE58_12780 [Tepidisphaeraceae bacterium]|jgi:hypothetical protein|nr:hypothetical protein [Tepidisphaeraceae bacterium]
MSSNTENTEAKLAAYVDGQLDPDQRAQIEQYLRANPDHQRLLADMIAQRQAVRDLPREKAPADIYDAMQAQLERSILLDDSGLNAPPSVRHSRRSQAFAIAAIALLAIGLAAVLYFALPSTRPNPVEIAATSPATTTRAPESTTNVTPLESAPITVASAPPIATTIALGGQLSPTQQPAPDHLVLLVSTNNPSQANRQVAAYLEANNIQWETIPSRQAFGSAKRELDTRSIETFGDKIDENAAPLIRNADQKVTSSFFKTADLSKDRARQPFILARRMSREQAIELTDTLSTDHGSQHARLVDPATTQPDQPVVATARPLGLPAPTTQPEEEPAATNKSFAAALPPLIPTTQLNDESGTPTTTPTTTTAPVTTQPDQTVDVVILVENQPSTTTPATAPTTVPTTAPAATEPAQP